MKPYQRYTSLFAAAALALSGSLQAQQQGGSSSGSTTTPSSGSDSMNSSAPSTMSSSSSALSDISRVTHDSVKNQLTVKDLIGASVYDTAGEKIGDVADVALSGSHAQQLASAFNAAQNEMDIDDDRATTAYPSTAGNSATSPTTGTPGLGADRDSSAMGSSTETAGNTSSDTSGNLSRTGSGASDGSSVARTAGAMYSSMTGSNEPHVFISVGGLWGIGDDLVSVPVSQLNYNAAEERFELASASKADVVALAEQKDDDAGYAASGSTMNDSATTAGKQAFSDEATKVQNALETNSETSAFAYKVSVTTDGESIELHGTVDNEDQHEKILEAARDATSHDVEDKLQVRE